MPFTLLPAVDVAGGRAVRSGGAATGAAATGRDASDVALAMQAAGADWIHLVDLDAAFGRGSNADLLAALVAELDVNVQLSGGIGDDRSLEWALSTGCARAVLATPAVADPAWCARALAAHGDRVAVGLDVRATPDRAGRTRYRLAARGSPGGEGGGDLWPALARLDREGCARYVVTDVSRDGMLAGPNVDLYRAVTRATTAAVIASGGISTIDDLVALAKVSAGSTNLEGGIVGTALHAGRFTLAQALQAVGHGDAGT